MTATSMGALSVSEFRGIDEGGMPFDETLAEPRIAPRASTFDSDGLLGLRRKVARFATSAGLESARATELVTAVNEIATNSVLHGGGKGALRMWRTDTGVVCEIRDAGDYRLSLAGAEGPGDRTGDSRGLWVANQLCDLVQVRRLAGGTVVRLHVKLRG